MDRLWIGTDSDGTRMYRTPEEMLRNTAIEGTSGSGKTSFAIMELEHLFFRRPDVPIMVSDGGETMVEELYARLVSRIESLEADGYDMQRFRDRLLYVNISSRNTSGVAIDVLKLRPRHDDDGTVRMETYKERTEAVMSVLWHMDEESETFRLVQKWGTAAFCLLIAAHGSPHQLPTLLEGNSPVFLSDLLSRAYRFMDDDIKASCMSENEAFLMRDYFAQQTAKLHMLYGFAPLQRDNAAGSTLRHFSWLSTDFLSYFTHDSIDFARFHDNGGVMLLTSAKQDNHLLSAVARRMFYAIRHSHVSGRPRLAEKLPGGQRYKPTLMVFDEQAGLAAKMLTEIVASSRNMGNYHWFLFQSGDQIGERAEHYGKLLSEMQVLVFFRSGSAKEAEGIAWRLIDPNLNAVRLETRSLAAGKSKTRTDTKTSADTANWGTSSHRVISKQESESEQESEAITESESEQESTNEQQSIGETNSRQDGGSEGGSFGPAIGGNSMRYLTKVGADDKIAESSTILESRPVAPNITESGNSNWSETTALAKQQSRGLAHGRTTANGRSVTHGWGKTRGVGIADGDGTTFTEGTTTGKATAASEGTSLVETVGSERVGMAERVLKLSTQIPALPDAHCYVIDAGSPHHFIRVRPFTPTDRYQLSLDFRKAQRKRLGEAPRMEPVFAPRPEKPAPKSKKADPEEMTPLTPDVSPEPRKAVNYGKKGTVVDRSKKGDA